MEVEVWKKKLASINEQSLSILKEKELKVAAYARVSTGEEEQQFSFNSQQKYYYNKINENKNWYFVGVYADEGISGTRTKNRKNFMKMISDALKGRIDFIFTKSISRFARNTVDTLKYVRMLKAKNVGVYFEEEKINTLDMSGELLLTILSSIAQQEIQNLSSHVILGLKMRMEQGVLVGFNSCYGYKYDVETKKIYINEGQAEVVRNIFKWYLNGDSWKIICQKLEDENVLTFRGKKRWNSCTLKQILTNEKYVGDLLLGKQYTVDAISHKVVKNNGEREQFYVKDHHEAIISREDYEKVQEKIEDTKEKYKNYFKNSPQNRYVFSGKLKCGFCGNSLKRLRANKSQTPKYYCKVNLQPSSINCEESKTLNETMIKDIFMQTMIKLKKKIKLENKFDKNINYQLSYSRRVLLNKDSLKEEFDEELFESVINYVIVGGYVENGVAEPYMIRFILKTEENFFIKQEITNEFIVNQNNISKSNTNLYTLMDYMNVQNFFCFEKNKENKLQRKFIEKIRVRVEIDDGKGD